MRGNITTLHSSLRIPDAPRNTNAQPLDASARAMGALGKETERIGNLMAKAQTEENNFNAKMDALRQLNDLNFEVATSGDGDIENTFAARSQEIHNDIKSRYSVSDSFDRWWQPAVESGRVQTRNRAFKGRVAAQRERIQQSAIEAVRIAGSAEDPVTRATTIDLAGDAIDDASRGGFLTGDEADGLKLKIRSESAELAVRDLITGDPQAAVDFIGTDNGLQILGVPDDRRQLLTNSAKKALSRLKKKDKKKALAAIGATKAEIRYDLGRTEKMLEDGDPVSDDLFDNLRQRIDLTGDPVFRKRIDLADGVNEFMSGLRISTPDEVRAEIADLSKSIHSKGDTPILDAKRRAGRKFLKRMNTELARDPLSFANETGVLFVDPIDVTAEDVSDQLLRRGTQAAVVANRYGVEPKFFTAEEAVDIGERLKTGDANDRLALSALIVQGLAGDAAQAFSEISKEAPIAAHVGALVTLGPQMVPVAREAFKGQIAIEQGLVTLPEKAKVETAAVDTLGSSLAMLGDFRKNVVTAATLIYAQRAVSTGTTEFDEDLFAQSMSAAIGGTDLGGGIGEVKGQKIVLPPTMTQSSVDTARGNIRKPHLTSMSAGGGMPTHGDGRHADLDEVKDAYLVSVGPGRYRVSTTDPLVAPRFLLDDRSGGYYILDFADSPDVPDRSTSQVGLTPQTLAFDDDGFPIDLDRPKLANSDGSVSTEETTTVEINSRWFNIPTIWDGKRLSEDASVARAKEQMRSGWQFPNFPDLDEALASAKARSDLIGKERN